MKHKTCAVTQLQFFQNHTVALIRAENHLRKTILDCMKDFFGENLSEEFKALAVDEKRCKISPEKMELDLSVEIQSLNKITAEKRQQLFKKISLFLRTESFADFTALDSYLQQANALLDKVELDSAGWQNRYQYIDSELQKALSELKTRHAIEKHLLNILIEWMSQCINQLPFWLPRNSYLAFQQIRQTLGKEQGLKQINQHRTFLAQNILFVMKNMMEQGQDEQSELARSCIQLTKLLDKTQESVDTTHSIEDYQLLWKALVTAKESFFEQIVNTKKNMLEKLTTYDMKQDEFLEKYQLSPSALRRAKYIQHRIFATENLLQQPDSILHSEKVDPVSGFDWLNKINYADLLFLLAIVSPEYLEDCLEQKVTLYQEILEDLQEQLKHFSSYWAKQTEAVIRSFRILRIYQSWQKTLNQKLNELGIVQKDEEENSEPDNDDWTTLLTLSRLFTYEKKNFFTAAFKKEKTNLLFSELISILESQPAFKNPKKILNYLSNKTEQIKMELQAAQKAIMVQYQLWEKIASFCGLALMEQPMYKIGNLGFDVELDAIAHLETLAPEEAKATYDTIDEFGNRILPSWLIEKLDPERDIKTIQGLAGLFCFIADQGLCSWMGYTYRSIAAINRILFSQFDAWVDFGATLGFDEISLCKTETAQSWLSGLAIHLLFQSSNYYLPAFFAYSAASTLSYCSSIIIDEVAHNEIEDKEWNPKAIAIGKFALQASIYPAVYSSALEFSEPSPAAALTTLGFYSDPSRRNSQKGYEDLSTPKSPNP